MPQLGCSEVWEGPEHAAHGYGLIRPFQANRAPPVCKVTRSEQNIEMLRLLQSFLAVALAKEYRNVFQYSSPLQVPCIPLRNSTSVYALWKPLLGKE